MVADVVVASRGKVVEDHDLVASGEELIGEVRPHEASASCDEHPHGSILGPVVLNSYSKGTIEASWSAIVGQFNCVGADGYA